MRDKIIEIASKEVGYKEKPFNLTKFGEWFGWNGVAWCGIFVSWVYDLSGHRIKNGGFTKGFAGCQTFYSIYKKNITSTPTTGDIVLFDWNGDKKFDHVGIFVKWINQSIGTFQTIEGNTSVKNQSNGGEVQIRIRSTKNTLFFNILP